MSLCSLLLYSLVFSVICVSPLGVGSCSAQVSRTAGQTSLAHFNLVRHPVLNLSVISLFIHSATDVFPPIFSFHTHFLSPLPIKELAVLDWTRKVDFPSNSASTHFVLLLRRTKPTCCCKTELFVFLPFSSALWLLWCLSYCEPEPCEVLSSPLLPRPFTYFILSSLHFSYHISSRLLCPPLSAFSSREPLRREENVRPIDASFSSRPLSQSDVPSQACWANERWRDINLIAVRDRYIDRGGCNKPRHGCWLPLRSASECKSRLIHGY